MLKTLIKKQTKELFLGLLFDQKTGKRKSTIKMVGTIILLIFIYGCLAISFGSMTFAFYPILGTEYEWIYFAVVSMMALFLGTFICVFYANSLIYKAKDNELLLAMPIKSRDILISRMYSLFLMALLFVAIIILPSTVIYAVVCKFVLVNVINQIIITLLLTLVVTSLSCIFGYVVAIVTSKFKNKSITTVILSFLFLGLYYFFIFRAEEFLNDLIGNAIMYGETIKNVAYLFYLFAQAALGDFLTLLIIALVSLIIFGLVFCVLDKSFFKIALIKDKVEKKEYKQEKIKVNDVDSSLLKKEFKHYLSSSTYMMNCSLGTVIMPIVAVVALINRDSILPIIELFEFEPGFICVIIVAIVCMFASMNDITSPSISLEGNNIWILQSMPIDPNTVFKAKKNLHLILTAPFAILLTLALLFVTKMDFSLSIFAIVIVLDYCMFSSSAGILLNLLMPNLSWTSEVKPIKQSMPVVICMFGGWILSFVIGIGGYLLINYISMENYLIILIVVFTLGSRMINRFLMNKGAKIFAKLS